MEEEEEHEEEAPLSTTAFDEILVKLGERCDAAKIPWARKQLPESAPFVTISFPCGREKRNLSFYDAAGLEALLAIDFEDYTFLDGLVAICSYSKGTIEAMVRASPAIALRFLLSRLLGVPIPAEADITAFPLRLSAADHNIIMTIGLVSDTLRVLSGRSAQAAAVVRIEGLTVAQHDHALSLLKRLSGALFFQIDMVHGTALQLMVERRATIGTIVGRARREPVPIEFPRTEYDEAPSSLYWYGRSALGMPLLQYLAYYQAIEYYYPVYSQAEAQRRIRAVIKDPTFRSDRDADIARILGAIRVTGSGFGDERAQLRATVHECVEPDQLRAFVTEVEARATFLASKVDGLTDKKLPVANKEVDLRNDVADRIYDIRCRIVHTKGGSGGSDVQMLLPYSRQAEQLQHDIALIRFVARAVLVATSTPLRIDSGVG